MILLNSGQDFFVLSWQLYAKESKGAYSAQRVPSVAEYTVPG